jgi:TolB-like protein/Flp pilus assembly protein TadD
MSGDPEQEYFSDGITEDIITELSRYTDFRVLARNATFVYKGKPVNPTEVGRELGAWYVLEGSIRKGGGRVRVTAQLIDASNGNHIWAERYDRDLVDIFAVQDEITQSIVGALGFEIQAANMDRVLKSDKVAVDAYDLRLRSLHQIFKYTPSNNQEAIRLAKEAIDLDPDNIGAYVNLALAHQLEAEMQWVDDIEGSINMANGYARKAVSSDERNAFAHQLLGTTEAWLGHHERAIDILNHAVELNPNRAVSYGQLSRVLSLAGMPEDALTAINKAMALNPHSPGANLGILGRAYLGLKRYEDAERAYVAAIAAAPTFSPLHAGLAVTLVAMGRVAEAGVAIEELLKVSPNYTLAKVASSMPYRHEQDRDRYVNALRQAGLPEE